MANVPLFNRIVSVPLFSRDPVVQRHAESFGRAVYRGTQTRGTRPLVIINGDSLSFPVYQQLFTTLPSVERAHAKQLKHLNTALQLLEAPRLAGSELFGYFRGDTFVPYDLYRQKDQFEDVHKFAIFLTRLRDDWQYRLKYQTWLVRYLKAIGWIV